MFSPKKLAKKSSKMSLLKKQTIKQGKIKTQFIKSKTLIHYLVIWYTPLYDEEDSEKIQLWLSPSLKLETVFHSSKFSLKGPLMSASTVPKHGGQMIAFWGMTGNIKTGQHTNGIWCSLNLRQNSKQTTTKNTHRNPTTKYFGLLTSSCSRDMRLKRCSKLRGITPRNWCLKLSYSSEGPATPNSCEICIAICMCSSYNMYTIYRTSNVHKNWMCIWDHGGMTVG